MASKQSQQHETEHRDGTKIATASEVWEKLLKKNPETPRHEMIEAAIKEAGMTPASANTMYQNWRSEKGMVDHRD